MKNVKKVILEKIKTSKVAKVIKLKRFSADEVFLSTLKEMKEPSLVREMALKIKRSKLFKETKKQILTKLYASASRLNKEGTVKRIPMNKSTFLYCLKGYKLNKRQLAA